MKQERTASGELSSTAWLVERMPFDGLAPWYLAVNGVYELPDAVQCGKFVWLRDPYAALQFARKRDALMLVGALRLLANEQAYKCTLPGLRLGDEAPAVVEHGWIAQSGGEA